MLYVEKNCLIEWSFTAARAHEDPFNQIDLGKVEPASSGTWKLPLSRAPIFQDWVIVLERIS